MLHLWLQNSPFPMSGKKRHYGFHPFPPASPIQQAQTEPKIKKRTLAKTFYSVFLKKIMDFESPHFEDFLKHHSTTPTNKPKNVWLENPIFRQRVVERIHLLTFLHLLNVGDIQETVEAGPLLVVRRWFGRGAKPSFATYICIHLFFCPGERMRSGKKEVRWMVLISNLWPGCTPHSAQPTPLPLFDPPLFPYSSQACAEDLSGVMKKVEGNSSAQSAENSK